MEPPAQLPLCGRWRLKPFELARPVLLRSSGPLTLGDFLAQPDPAVAAEFRALTVEQRQALVLARLKDAPADRPLSLFGQDGYTFADARQAVQDGSPLGVRLIGTILSQHTSDANSARAFAALLAHFGDFEAVRQAPVEEIADVIRSGGLARIKAQRIKEVLEQIAADRGSLDLSFLAELGVPAARAYLTSLSGVGPKTAACVLLFNCGLPALPVDTHVHRVSRRLGLIGPRTGATQAHTELEALVPPEQVFSFHVNLIRHGRQICKAPRPRCQSCPLENICPKIGVTRSLLAKGGRVEIADTPADRAVVIVDEDVDPVAVDC